MLSRHDTRIKPGIVVGRKEFSIPRLGASADADSVSGASQDEVANRMWIVGIENSELNGDCVKKAISACSSGRRAHGMVVYDAAGGVLEGRVMLFCDGKM